MQKTLTLFLALALLAGCSRTRKSSKSAAAESPAKETAAATSPAFALPGVPLASDAQAAPVAEKKSEAPAAPPAEAVPAEAKPAEAAANTGGDLAFHLSAAGKYSARKKYRSAALEYGAATGFLPARDARAVYLLERQGAMMLKAGNEAKAREHFASAIEKAKELGTSGADLAKSYLGLGYCLEKEGKIQDAISSYEKAMEFSSSKTVKAKIANTISDLKKTVK